MTVSPRRTTFRLALLALVLMPTLASAQAWVNDPGELAINLRSDYQTAQGVWHGSTLVTGLPAASLNSGLAAEYVPLEHLAVGVGLSANGATYTGPQSIPGNTSVILAHGSQDDGKYHWNITDLDLDAHYQVYDGAVAITPLVRGRVPVTNYENRGYAAAGSHLAELGVGVDIGRYGLGLDDLVLQVGYTFTYVQKASEGGAETEQYRVNRSDAEVSLAYIVTSKFIAGVAGAFRYTHDGFDLTSYPNLPAGSQLRTWHDPVLKVRYFAPALLASYQFNPNWSLMGRFAAVVWGENASNPISFGITVGYTTNLLE